MRLILHRQVHSDVDAIMEYYERVASPELADDFYAELRRFMLDTAERPESFSIRERDLRRVNLHRFPLRPSVSHRRRCCADSRRSPSSEASGSGHSLAVNSN
jgi:plasmid stabilization system protein ParE